MAGATRLILWHLVSVTEVCTFLPVRRVGGSNSELSLIHPFDRSVVSRSSPDLTEVMRERCSALPRSLCSRVPHGTKLVAN
jgi:hypothetical protein